MNYGTKIRTILVIATCLNTALLATDVAQFGNETINLVYKILSVTANFVIVFCATWFNNDYTQEGAVGTAITRQMKKTRDFAVDTVEEPDDSYIVEDEYIEEVEDGKE